MVQQAFGADIAPANVISWNADGGSYSNQPATPVGRAALNGDTRILVTGIVEYLGGRGGARSGTIYVGGASLPVAIPASDANQAVGGPTTTRALVGGGGAGVQVGNFIDGNGACYFGWNSLAGRTIFERGGGSRANAELAGYYDWAQAPSVPLSVSVTPNSGSQVTLSWASPGDHGGVAVNDFYIEYATNPSFAGAGRVNAGGYVFSKVIAGLTPGQTYYFRVAAYNEVTNLMGTAGPFSGVVSATLGTAPGAPTGLVVTTDDGLASVTWVAPASVGGSPVTGYSVEYANNSGFTGSTTVNVGPTVRSLTRNKLAPNTTYYFRVKATNAIGTSAASTAASAATPARTALDIVKAGSVNIGGVHVTLRSDGGTNPVLSLGYVAFGAANPYVSIDAAVPVGAGATQFAASGGERNVTLVADAAGNVYLIGLAGNNDNTLLVRRYERTAPTTWVLNGTLSQALPATGDPLTQFAAVFVAGSPSTILVLARRAGTVGAGALSYATLDLAAITASTGSLFLNYGSDPSWLPTPPAGAAFNSGVLDAVPISGNRVVLLGNGFAVVDVVNGVVSGVAKSANGTALTGAWARVLGVNVNTFALLTIVAGALSWTFYGTNGSSLGSGSYAGSNAQGGTFGTQWDAFVDKVAKAVVVYYIADDSARKLESIDISPVTFANTAAAVLTSALGAASSTNPVLRVPEGVVDERRVIVETANDLAGVKSTAAYYDLSGNLAPNSPSLVDEIGYDAANARTLAWAFGDSNLADTQTSYELEVQRVSDSVNVVATGKVASTTSSRLIAANTLVNGVNYRWRVRTYDVLDTVGAWSSYDTFTTAALGTLTITNPAADNPAGLEVSSLDITWSYVQANGYVQTQRRVRVIRVSDAVVLSDTTMQASVATSYTVTALPTDVPVRIEVSIVTNASGTPTVTANRLLTTSYGSPMVPVLSLSTTESAVVIQVINPTPTGSRPEVVTNYIERRETGSGADFERVGSVGYAGTFTDHAVRSGIQYDYQARGVS